MRHNKTFEITVRIIISASFLQLAFIPTSFCSQVSPDNIKIPDEYGWVASRDSAGKGSLKSNAPLIISIQDAHCNYSAQMNIYHILKSLIDSYGVKLIGVEGGSGDCGLSYLRDNAAKPKRIEVAEKFLKSGEISGEEYLDIVSDYDITLWGIENMKLYKENLSSFYEIEALRSKLKPWIDAIKIIINRLKSKIYSRDMLSFEEKEDAYRNNKMKLDDLIAYLCESAAGYHVSLDDFSELFGYARMVNDRKRLSLDNVQSESDSLLAELSDSIPDTIYNELKEKAYEYKDNKITDVDFYLYLDGLTKRHNINVRERYPNFHSYLRHIHGQDNLDKDKMLHEMAAIIDKLKVEIVKDSQDGSMLMRIAKNVDTIDRLLNISLSPDEFAAAKKAGDSLFPHQFVKFLEERGARHGIGVSLAEYSGMIGQDLDKLFRFYEIGRKREESFLKNITLKMKADNVNTACIVAGGFHSDGLKALLSREGYNCVVIFPRITEPMDMNKYYSVLRTKSPFKIKEL